MYSNGGMLIDCHLVLASLPLPPVYPTFIADPAHTVPTAQPGICWLNSLFPLIPDGVFFIIGAFFAIFVRLACDF